MGLVSNMVYQISGSWLLLRRLDPDTNTRFVSLTDATGLRSNADVTCPMPEGFDDLAFDADTKHDEGFYLVTNFKNPNTWAE